MKNFIKVTHIDTGSHGYLSVSKKDFLEIGGDPEKITPYSGHTYTRLYLEEDIDASYFVELAKSKDVNLVFKDSYNPSFAIKQNYDSKLFHYRPSLGDGLTLSDGRLYSVVGLDSRGIRVDDCRGFRQYHVSNNNPFNFIQSVL